MASILDFSVKEALPVLVNQSLLICLHSLEKLLFISLLDLLVESLLRVIRLALVGLLHIIVSLGII